MFGKGVQSLLVARIASSLRSESVTHLLLNTVEVVITYICMLRYFLISFSSRTITIYAARSASSTTFLGLSPNQSVTEITRNIGAEVSMISSAEALFEKYAAVKKPAFL